MLAMTQEIPFAPTPPDGLEELGRFLVLHAGILALSEPGRARRKLTRARSIFEWTGNPLWLDRIIKLEEHLGMEDR